MASPRPNNTDIINLLSINHEEVTKRLSEVEAQVKYTNGQVRDLRTWQAVMQDRESREAQTSSNPKVDWQKMLMYALGLVGTALALLGTVLGAK